MKTDSLSEFECEVISRLEVLKSHPDRDPSAAFASREAFLRQARESARSFASAPESTTEKTSKKSGMEVIWSIFALPKTRRLPLLTPVVSVLIIVALLLGGTGVTAVAAHGSLPDSPLYPVKLWQEDVQLALESDPGRKFQLEQEFLDERVDEIVTLIERGGIPPASFEEEVQREIEQSVLTALNLPPDQSEAALVQMQARLETHTQALLQLQSHGSAQALASVVRTRLMMLAKMKVVDEKLTGPKKGGNPTEPSPADLTETGQPGSFGLDGEKTKPAPGGPSGQPTDKPGQKPTNKPTGKPDVLPGQSATPKPTHQPAAVKTPKPSNGNGNNPSNPPAVNPPGGQGGGQGNGQGGGQGGGSDPQPDHGNDDNNGHGNDDKGSDPQPDHGKDDHGKKK